MTMPTRQNRALIILIIALIVIGGGIYALTRRSTIPDQGGVAGIIPGGTPSGGPSAIAINLGSDTPAILGAYGSSSLRYMTDEGQIKEYSITSGSKKVLATLEDPLPRSILWSEDGKHAVLSYPGESDDEPLSLRVLTIENGQMTPINGSAASWINNGTLLTAVPTNTGSALMVTPLGGQSTQETVLSYSAHELRVDPTGKLIAILGNNELTDGELPHIDTYNLTTHKLTAVSGQNIKIVGWSKSGVLAYTRLDGDSSVVGFFGATKKLSAIPTGAGSGWNNNSLLTIGSQSETAGVPVISLDAVTGTSSSFFVKDIPTNISQVSRLTDKTVLLVGGSAAYVLSL